MTRRKYRAARARTRSSVTKSVARSANETDAAAGESTTTGRAAMPVLRDRGELTTSGSARVGVHSPVTPTKSVTPTTPVTEGGSRPRRASSTDRGVSGCTELLPPTLVGLAPTYQMDAAALAGRPLVLRFVGHRVGGGADRRDHFDRLERVGSLPVDAGRVSVTATVTDINAGRWQVSATPVAEGGRRLPRQPVDLPRQRCELTARPATVLRRPGVRLYAWPVLVVLGVVVALACQAWLVGAVAAGPDEIVGVSLIAVVVGYLSAKIWYLVWHRKPVREFVFAGACIQGFLLGGFTALIIGSTLVGAQVPALLDATTPGVLFAMALGRPGCLISGCCAGRPTSSQWGVRCSDRRVLTRRVPVQLLEALAALIMGLAALEIFLAGPPRPSGALFVAGFAAYTAVRQLLFPLRDQPRKTTLGPRATLGFALATLLAVSTLAILAS